MHHDTHAPTPGKSNILEPTTGIEPVNLFLTKEALYRLSYVGLTLRKSAKALSAHLFNHLERETRLELATSSLEGWSSTN